MAYALDTTVDTLKKGDLISFHSKEETPEEVAEDWSPDDPAFIYTEKIAHDVWDGTCRVFVHQG